MALTAVLLFRTLRLAHTADPALTFVAGLIGLAVPRGRPLCQMDLRLRQRKVVNVPPAAAGLAHHGIADDLNRLALCATGQDKVKRHPVHVRQDGRVPVNNKQPLGRDKDAKRPDLVSRYGAVRCRTAGRTGATIAPYVTAVTEGSGDGLATNNDGPARA